VGPAWIDTGLVFTREDGQGWHPDYVTKRFAALVRKHGPPPVSLHSLRHAAASLMLAAGTDIAVVSKRTRHSTIRLTSDTYWHLIGGVGRQRRGCSGACTAAAPSMIPSISPTSGSIASRVVCGSRMFGLVSAGGAGGTRTRDRGIMST